MCECRAKNYRTSCLDFPFDARVVPNLTDVCKVVLVDSFWHTALLVESW